MNYYLDTEFHEGFNKPLFGIKRHFIDLISIGIVSEDRREYYAIGKDFDIKAAWNSYQIEQVYGDMRNRFPNGKKVYWLRENVLRSIFEELKFDEYMSLTDKGVVEFTDIIKEYPNREDQLNFFKQEFLYRMRVADWIFNLSNFKKTINEYGKSNKQIAEEIKNFINAENLKDGGQMILGHFFPNKKPEPEFYGYYCDYDWVLLASLFGKMIDLPTGFPYYCRDLKQMLDERAELAFSIDKKNNSILPNGGSLMYNNVKGYLEHLQQMAQYPKQTNEHNALADAKWNKELFHFLNNQ